MQRELFKNIKKVGAKREDSVKYKEPSAQLLSVVAASCMYCPQGLMLSPCWSVFTPFSPTFLCC